MEESQVLRNTNSQTAEDRQLKTDQKSLHGEPPNASTFHRTNPAFMSPTDNFFSPCTRKLTSKRGLHLMALFQKKSPGFQFPLKVEDSDMYKEVYMSTGKDGSTGRVQTYMSQRQLGKAFQKESSIQDSKENKPN